MTTATRPTAPERLRSHSLKPERPWVKRTFAVLRTILLVAIVAFALGPLVWAFISSFKTYAEINSSAFSLPSRISLDNYIAAFKYAPIAKFFWNSVVVVCASLLITVVLVCLCAYVVSRFQFRGKVLIVLAVSAALLLPAQAISQPLFVMMKTLGLFDTRTGLALVYAAMGIPTSFFVMVSFFSTIPTALEEAAYIDGAGFLRTFLCVILPLAKPGIATIVILQFINTWNEFFFALMLTSGDSARTVPIALNYYMGTFANNYSAMFAAVILTVLPTILVFVIAQRQVIDSLAAGAVKE